MLRIGVLVSGGGTNLQAIIDAIDSGVIKNGKIVTVVSNKDGVYALERAKKYGIESCVIKKKDYASASEFDVAIKEYMQSKKVDLIVLAGFLSIIGKELLNEYENRIINVHPSLIPAFCGDGYYGLKVHKAVLDYGVKVSGATVHFVNEVTDGGAIILQKAVDVSSDDTPESLQLRIMQQAEWDILPKAIELFCSGKIKIENRKVKVI